MKPHPQIFRLTADKLGVSVEHILHGGDAYEADVVDANRVGAKGVWLNPLGKDLPGMPMTLSETSRTCVSLFNLLGIE